MKKLLLITCLLSSCICVRPEDAIIAWNNNPPEDLVIAYKVWSWNGSNQTLIATVVTNRTPVLTFRGKQTLTVTAINEGGESNHSTNLVFIARPGQPTGLLKQ